MVEGAARTGINTRHDSPAQDAKTWRRLQIFFVIQWPFFHHILASSRLPNLCQLKISFLARAMKLSRFVGLLGPLIKMPPKSFQVCYFPEYEPVYDSKVKKLVVEQQPWSHQGFQGLWTHWLKYQVKKVLNV